MKSEPKTLVIWAVDPFSGFGEPQREALRVIRSLQRRLEFRVQPVFAAMPPLPNLKAGFSAEMLGALRERSQQECDLLTRGGLRPKHCLPLKLCEAKGRGISQQVAALLKEARTLGAEFIVTSTRARRGPARWFVGSFAETLSLKSDVPLVVVNPSWIHRDGLRELLVPTDFSKQSHRAYVEILRFAKQTGMSVRVYHKMAYEVGPVWDLNTGSTPIFTALGSNDVRSAARRTKKWTDEAAAAGIKATAEVDETPGSLVRGILQRCAGGRVVVAMAAQAGRAEAALVGSVTRQVIREARAPIWVVHPAAQARLRQHRGRSRAVPRPPKPLGGRVEPLPRPARPTRQGNEIQFRF